jgi:hypothetical protein
MEKMEEILKEIAKNTRPKFSTQIIVTSNKTSFYTTFNPPLELEKDKNYEVALVNLETYYSFPNISEENNMFEYSEDNGKTWIKIFIPEGAYELKVLNPTIQSMIDPITFLKNKNLIAAGRHSEVRDIGITIEYSPQTLKSIMTIKPNYKVSFKEKNTFANLLGFGAKEYGVGTHESENIINILSVNSILIHLNIINGSFVNGSRIPVIYSFFPKVSPGYKIVETPKNLIYLPVTARTIRDLQVKITDQNDKLLNLRKEMITIRFHIREV